MKAIVNANIVLENGILENGAVLFGEKIEAVAPERIPAGAEVIDAGGRFLFPGLIDVHTHGYCGREVLEGTADAVEFIAGKLLKDGVTGFLPTVATAPLPAVGAALDAVRATMGKGRGAKVHGAHMEGVFISVEKKGAHNPNLILPPDTDFLAPYADILRIVITAPEKYPEFVQWCAERGIVAAMGHTNATYQEAMEGIRRGVTQATHLFNGMRGLTHREPGAAGAALLSDRVNCELIADTAHVAKELYPLVYRMKGPDKILLITDSSIASGMGPGVYTSNARTVYVDELVGRLENGTISSSVVPLRRDILNFHRHSGATLPEAVRMATLNPARVLKLDHALGSIREGKRADLFVADGEMNVLLTVLDGEIVYRGDAPC